MKHLFLASLLLVTTCSAVIAQEMPDISLPKLEIRISDLINSERQTNGLDPLRLDAALSAIARRHSVEMARGGYFDHTNPEGRDPKARLEAAGYSCGNGLAENILRTNMYSKVKMSGNRKSYDWIETEDLAKSVVEELMNGRKNRRNSINKKYRVAGIGLGISDDAKLYVTEMFCAP